MGLAPHRDEEPKCHAGQDSYDDAVPIAAFLDHGTIVFPFLLAAKRQTEMLPELMKR